MSINACCSCFVCCLVKIIGNVNTIKVWPKTQPGLLALNAARPGLNHGPAAHTVLRNRNATSHATSKRRPPPGLVYCSLVRGSVCEQTSIHEDILSRRLGPRTLRTQMSGQFGTGDTGTSGMTNYHTGPYWTTPDDTGRHRTPRDHTGPPETNRNRRGLEWTSRTA